MLDTSSRPPCPYCSSTTIVRNGKRKDRPLYKCRTCGRQYRIGGAIHGLRFSPELIGEAIDSYYRGASLEEVVSNLARDRQYAPLSRNTVSRWVRVYSAKAVLQVSDRKARPGWSWVVMALPAQIRSEGVWVWCVIYFPSQYVMACDISADRDVDAAYRVMSRAKGRADGMPAGIVYDADGPCGEVVRDVFPTAVSVRLQEPTTNTLPIALREALERLVSRIRRSHDPDKALRHLEDWTIFHNHLGGQVSAQGTTPGEAAEVDNPLSTWADVVRLGTT